MVQRTKRPPSGLSEQRIERGRHAPAHDIGGIDRRLQRRGHRLEPVPHRPPFRVDDLDLEPDRVAMLVVGARYERSEEHTSELQSQSKIVCPLLLEKKKKAYYNR